MPEQLPDANAFRQAERERLEAALTADLEGLLSAALPGWRRDPEVARQLVGALRETAFHVERRAWYIDHATSVVAECSAGFAEQTLREFAERWPHGSALFGPKDTRCHQPRRIQKDREYNALRRRTDAALRRFDPNQIAPNTPQAGSDAGGSRTSADIVRGAQHLPR